MTNNGLCPCATQSSTRRRSLSRHPKYYINGADLHLIVGNYLFRVHSSFFDRDATRFFPASKCPHEHQKGDSDATAIIINDVDSTRFEKFLWVFYNPTYSLHDARVEDWSDILMLAHTWGFVEVKQVALRELHKLNMYPVERIALYHTCDVGPKYLIPLYEYLCIRPMFPSQEEAERMGLLAVIKLLAVREKVRTLEHFPTPTSPDPTSYGPHFVREDVIEIVAKEFEFPVPSLEDMPSLPPSGTLLKVAPLKQTASVVLPEIQTEWVLVEDPSSIAVDEQLHTKNVVLIGGLESLEFEPEPMDGSSYSGEQEGFARSSCVGPAAVGEKALFGLRAGNRWKPKRGGFAKALSKVRKIGQGRRMLGCMAGDIYMS
ncbi:hypothetical protein AMATHDRAFT_69540 [Amanita thiersii Skay4041]|uniref:BTB domain-containing protein n=1 Tax=Amanita thiersii Skay4041 TaxID=703135 RepID=A0A2A9NFN4_9AGAR|nr:hypothetical protein AMATHDRAFT_69540 [Amanita thiersii Skay4041]